MNILATTLFMTLLANAAIAGGEPVTPELPMSTQEDLPVVPGTEAIELGDPASPVRCLLIHGFAGSRMDFADLGEKLAVAGCHVRLERLPGHGTTPEDMETTTADELVDHVLAAVRTAKAEYETVILVGFSMGGAISTIVAAEEPVDRLVLLAPCYEIKHQWYYVERPEWWAEKLQPMVRWVPKPQNTVQVNRREAKPMLFSYPRIPTQAVLTLAELGQRAGDPVVLGGIDAPVLMLHSPGDFSASQAASHTAFPLLGSSDTRYVLIDARNNHHMLWDHDRAAVVQEITAFLAPDLPPPDDAL